MKKIITNEFYVITNDKGEFFAKDKLSGGYPFWSIFPESAERFENKEEITRNQYFSMFSNFFLNSKFQKVKITKIIETIE